MSELNAQHEQENPKRDPSARERFADSLGLTREQLKILLSSCTTEEVYICIEILKAKKHRSAFRASLDNQIRNWLNAGGTSRLKPLSPQQFKTATPKWPVNIVIPADDLPN